jgi:hypothetical protein
MPLYRVVEAYRTDAQEILLVLEHGETIYRVEGDADIVESREMPGVMPLPRSPRPQGPCPDTSA